MRVVVVGASGNVGTSVLRSLEGDPAVTGIVAVARRPPPDDDGHPAGKLEWRAADVASDDLEALFDGADAVVHLAWAIQPSRDERALWRTNVVGSARVFDAAAQAGAASLVYASSVGAYSAGPKDRPVDEAWPTHGIPTSFYSRHKAYVERLLDVFELRNPGTRVVRLRPALIFKREAASEVRRLFIGPFVPSPLVRPALIPVVPDLPGLRFQAVHSVDVGEAYRLAVVSNATGAFNLAAEPVLDAPRLAELLGARLVPVPARAARAAAALTWGLHLQPSPPGWLDLALESPLLDSTRARVELGWSPERDAGEALLELLGGLRQSAGADTPTLRPDAGGPARSGEVSSGVGRRQS